MGLKSQLALVYPDWVIKFKIILLKWAPIHKNGSTEPIHWAQTENNTG